MARKPSFTDATDLRQQAEAQLQARPAAPAPEADLRRLNHELEVHQIELEMQNQELQNSQVELEAVMSAYMELYNFAPVGYFTLDRNSAITQLNLTGASQLCLDRAQLMGRHFSRFVAATDAVIFKTFLQQVFTGMPHNICEVGLLRNGSPAMTVQFEGRLSPDRQTCRVVMVDVTERAQALVAHRELVQKLQAALAQVKQLSRLLPICAGCKKIRDDQGYWHQVETYISAHSETIFSHSFCPGCLPKFFPEGSEIK